MLSGIPVSQLEPFFAALDSAPCLRVCRAWNLQMDTELVWDQRLRKQVERDADSDRSLGHSIQWLQRKNRSPRSHQFEIVHHEHQADTSYIVTSSDPDGEIRSRETIYLRRYPARLRLDVHFLRQFQGVFGLNELEARFEELGALANRSKRTPKEPTSKLVVRANLARMSAHN